MLSVADIKLVEKIMEHKGLIDVQGMSDARKVFPNGDRRKRPVFWLTNKEVLRLQNAQALQKTPKGYVIKHSLARELRLKRQCAKFTQADRHERDVFTPAGVMRKANIVHGHNVLERLSRKKDRDGRPILTAAEVEAGRHLAKDYALAGLSHISTQNFMASATDSGRHQGKEEDRILRQMTARTRLQAAKIAMGDGLDKAVIAVCCRDESLDSVERAEHWVKSSGLTILKLGLSRLVKLYGTEPGQSRS